MKFADHLRQQGVAANATPRAFRDASSRRTFPLASYWRDRRAANAWSTTIPGRPGGREAHEAKTR